MEKRLKPDYIIMLILLIMFLLIFSYENNVIRIDHNSKVELVENGIKRLKKVPYYLSKIKYNIDKTKIVTDSIVSDTIKNK